jgi:hypothetical protein
VSWERMVLDVLEDLEQQADGQARVQRDAEVAELARAEYAEVSLESRLHAAVGYELEVTLRGLGRLRGRVARVGDGWLLMERPPGAELVALVPALVGVRGLPARVAPPAVRPVTARLRATSVLRRVSEERDDVVLHRVEGEPLRGPLSRVGSDFVELGGPGGVVPLSALAAVQRAPGRGG